jgi:hypothetical protein
VKVLQVEQEGKEALSIAIIILEHYFYFFKEKTRGRTEDPLLLQL